MRVRAWAAGIVMSLMLTAAATAQQSTSRPFAGRGGGGGMIERAGYGLLDRSQAALKDLGLSDDQKNKIDAIFKKAHVDLDGMRKDLESMQPRERVQQIQDFFKSLYQDVGAELNDAQRAQMQKLMEQLRPNRDRAGFRDNSAAASSRPATAPTGGDGAARLERLRANLAKLDLTDDQKTKIKAMLEDIRDRAQSLRQEAQNGSQDAKEKLRNLSGEVREKLVDILTPEQLEKLRDMTNADGAAPTSAPAAMNDKTNDNKMSEPTMRDSDSDRAAKIASAKPDAAPATKPSSAGPQIGDTAPPLAVKKIDGGQFQLASMKGRVIVLEFGSWTSPAFRDRAAAMEKLKTEYGQKAQFFVIYGREAHAKGEWEVDRNKDKDIVVDQPTKLEARMDLAKKARQELKISVPILVDTMGNDAAIAYGAGANSAFVINRDGLVVARQQWFDPGGLHRAIDDAVKAMPTTKPSATPVAVE